MAHPFICPNCGHRTTEVDRNIGFTRQPKGCAKCGFAFLFELLDDYYPAPDAAFFVCDGEGRVIGCGKNSFALHRPGGGRGDRPARRARCSACASQTARTRSRRCSSGACAHWTCRCRSAANATSRPSAKADMFPAYDDDGGLLLVLTPDK